MLKQLAALSLLFSVAAPAQVITSYQTNNPSTMKGDPNRIVCQKEETIGTRLGAKKVCLTVAEWQARQRDDRDQTESVQGGTRVCANPPCPSEGLSGGPPH
ncbi:MAG TPA: hypothetical protein VNS53_04045 [Sphingomicrobium sp.]|jgi:hypothetical protein|nr:hypothetical protein [Sphingomicrobium sp.]